MSFYLSSRFKFKPEFISLVKSSSLKCIEHKDEVFPGVHIFLRSNIKSIHFFRLLSLCGHVVPQKGILCMLIPFASSLMFPHLAATHLSGIFEKRAEIPRLVCFQWDSEKGWFIKNSCWMQIKNFFSLKFLGWCLDSDEKTKKKIRYGHFNIKDANTATRPLIFLSIRTAGGTPYTVWCNIKNGNTAIQPLWYLPFIIPKFKKKNFDEHFSRRNSLIIKNCGEM